MKSLLSSLYCEKTSWLTNLIREELPGKGNFLIYFTSITKVLFIKLKKKKFDLKFKFENLSVIFKQLLYIWLGNRENSKFSFHISEFSEKNTILHTVLHNLTVPLNETLMLNFPVELCVPFAILLKAWKPNTDTQSSDACYPAIEAVCPRHTQVRTDMSCCLNNISREWSLIRNKMK